MIGHMNDFCSFFKFNIIVFFNIVLENSSVVLRDTLFLITIEL